MVLPRGGVATAAGGIFILLFPYYDGAVPAAAALPGTFAYADDIAAAAAARGTDARPAAAPLAGIGERPGHRGARVRVCGAGRGAPPCDRRHVHEAAAPRDGERRQGRAAHQRAAREGELGDVEESWRFLRD